MRKRAHLGRPLAALVERKFNGKVAAAARAWGVPNSTLVRYVRGERPPTVAVLARIARIEKLPLADLVAEKSR